MTPIRLADPEKRHEAERGLHHPQAEDRAHHAVRRGGEDQQRLDGIVELEQQRQVNAEHGDRQDQRQIAEAVLLLVVLAADGRSCSPAAWSSRTRASLGSATLVISDARWPGAGKA